MLKFLNTMGKLIIRFKDNSLQSFKCNSKERAEQIVSKRKNVSDWNWYSDNERMPIVRKTKKKEQLLTLKDYELMLKQYGLI